GPFRKMFPTRKSSVVTVDDDPGEPLFLTPYLEQGQIEKARQLSSVELPPYKQQSFSGYLTV
ncbi:unnamed protein product, partial [Rotaria socialis]